MRESSETQNEYGDEGEGKEGGKADEAATASIQW